VLPSFSENGFSTSTFLCSVSLCGATGINSTQAATTSGSVGSYTIPLASSLYMFVGIFLSLYL
jgi:hypothetical protein